MKYTFSKAERLKSRKTIGQLFKNGKSFGQYPLRLVWTEMDSRTNEAVQFAVSVPKKKFPQAVQRNQLKRKIREAYRLNKPYLHRKLAGQERQYGWMILYVAKEALPYAVIEKSMQRIIGRFVKITR